MIEEIRRQFDLGAANQREGEAAAFWRGNDIERRGLFVPIFLGEEGRRSIRLTNLSRDPIKLHVLIRKTVRATQNYACNRDERTDCKISYKFSNYLCQINICNPQMTLAVLSLAITNNTRLTIIESFLKQI